MGKNDSAPPAGAPSVTQSGKGSSESQTLPKLTAGDPVVYTDNAGTSHVAFAGAAPKATGLLVWVFPCDEHGHQPYRLHDVEFDGNGKPGTWKTRT